MSALLLPSFFYLAKMPDNMFAEKDIAPITVFAYASHALWVDKDSPFQTLDDFIAHARSVMESAGQPLLIAGTGSYTDQHMANQIFARLAGLVTRYYPVIGSTEAASRVKDKEVQACWGYALTLESMPGMRPLAVASAERVSSLPDVPTFRERRMEFLSGAHFGIAMAAESVPEKTRLAVASRISLFLADPALRRLFAARGASALSLSPEDMQSFLNERRREAENLQLSYPLGKYGFR